MYLELGNPFNLPLTNSALLSTNDQPYRLDFTNIVSDSRCPVGTECLRPDVAIVEVTLTDLGTNADPVTHLLFFDSGPSETIVGPFTIQVLALAPPAEQVRSPDDYLLTLVAKAIPTASNLDVQMISSATNVQVGDRVTYTATAAGVSRAQYTLTVNGVVVGITRFDGALIREAQTQMVELIDWTADASSASWTVEVLAVGEFQMEASISGSVDGTSVLGAGSLTVSGN
jgi:hypothetical protein